MLKDLKSLLRAGMSWTWLSGLLSVRLLRRSSPQWWADVIMPVIGVITSGVDFSDLYFAFGWCVNMPASPRRKKRAPL